MFISKDIRYVGVNDHAVDLFEGQYAVPRGMAYNSYVIMDDKIAVMDSVDGGFTAPWLRNISETLASKAPDYLIVQHMEPDHSASITAFMDTYPSAVVISSAKAFAMMTGFFGKDYADRRIVIKDGDSLCLGRHTLTFTAAPMIHWPEVVVTYDACDRVLFSADAFGKFGALDEEEPWDDEARRYYIGIVGKYGAQVQALLKKLSALDVRTICPLHGPVLCENLAHYLHLYDTWSAYHAESKGVVIAYASMHGHTKEAALLLASKLCALGQQVTVYDLARCDMAQAVADAFRYDRLALATPTYNGDVFPFMNTFIHHLTARGYRSRTVGLIENGSWAPTAAKVMRGMLADSKDLTILEPTVRILSALNSESTAQIDALAQALIP